MEDVYRRILAAALGAQLDYYSEYVDQFRFAEPEYQASLRAYLRGRYAKSPPHVVIATTTATLRVARTANDDLFPSVPIVFQAGKGVSPPPHSTGVVSTVDLGRTLELALAFHPAVKLVAVISGTSEFDKGYGNLARAQFRRFENRVSFSYLYGLPMADLEQAVARLPGDAIIGSCRSRFCNDCLRWPICLCTASTKVCWGTGVSVAAFSARTPWPSIRPRSRCVCSAARRLSGFR
jgi:hypothetical protein